MAYNSGFLRLVFLFQALNSVEIAETQVTLSGGPGSVPLDIFGDWDEGDLEDSAQDLYGDVLNGGNLFWADYSNLFAAKLSAIDVDGSLLADPLVKTLDTPRTGTTTNIHPQLSVLMSFWSGFTFGHANYGRMYLPHTMAGLTTSSPFSSSATALALANDGQDFVDHMNTRAQGKANQSLVAIASKAGTGTTKDVAFVRAGRVTDSQRRRYNSITPNYQVVAVS